jgi:hypothetical protein
MIYKFKEFLKKRKNNIKLLRNISDSVGSEIESWDYQELLKPSEKISFSRQINGIDVFFSIEAYETKSNEDIHVCVDIDSNIPTFPYIKQPSYVFWKRKDGSVYY